MNNFKFPQAKKFKFPIVVHIYTAFLLVIFAIGILYLKFFSSDINIYVKENCTKKIDDTVEMTQKLLNDFSGYMSQNNEESLDWFYESYGWENFSSIAMSNDVSIAVLELNENNKYELLWPTDKALAKVASQYINAIPMDYDINSKDVGVSSISENDTFCYKMKVIAINDPYSDVVETSNVYVLYYIATSSYFKFASLFLESLFRTLLFAILGTGFLCILISIPLIASIYKMVKYSKKIAKGDFNNYHTFVVSRELQDLSDSMNFMADRLRENDKEQKQFFQNVSHELRTPLQSIQGYAEGLKYDVFSGEDKDTAVNVIINESERLSSMVENLLSISKMDMAKNGNYEVNKTNISVKEIVAHEIENIRGNVLLNDKELIHEVQSEDKLIYANESDILRMLDNIFANCLRYSKSKIFFYTTIVNDKVNFTIYDDGPGFTEDVLANLFVRFAKGSDGKHGIGLSLVKAIAEEHDGSVKAYNKEGFGACFEIEIPCASPNEQLSKINKSN